MNASTALSNTAALQFTNVGFRYPEADADVLRLPELEIPQGQFVSLLGASGSGKSTLLRLVAGLLQPTSGTIAGPSREQSRRDVGMVFQSPNLVPWRNARKNVTLPAELGSSPTPVDSQTVNNLFSLVGLTEDDSRKRPAELSGGMQMRVSLARAMVLQPSLLLLDEPFAALDDMLRMQLEEDVRQIHNGRTLTSVLVTHNISEAVFMSDRVLVLGGAPSVIHADVKVDLPPQRTLSLRSHSAFHDLVDSVTQSLRSAHQGTAGQDQVS